MKNEKETNETPKPTRSKEKNQENPVSERDIFLALGRDLTKVRAKDDLMALFSKRIKELHYFTHTIVTLIDNQTETYWPFLLNTDASPIRNHTFYDQLVASCFNLGEPFINSILSADGPVSYLLEDVMDAPKSPKFLRVNYEGGIKEILMTTLWNADEPMGFFTYLFRSTEQLYARIQKYYKRDKPTVIWSSFQ